jgi:hypothetical protein
MAHFLPPILRSSPYGARAAAARKYRESCAKKRIRFGGIMRFGPFLGIAILLAILWACGFLMFHVASGLIHILLVLAVISLVIHLFAGTRSAA